MKILLTGASGFIGQHCLRSLAKGNELHALTRSLKNVPDSLKALEHVRWHELALRDHAAVADLLGELRVDRCLHLAWDTEPGVYLDHVAGNIGLLHDSLSLLRALIAAECPQITMLGSCAEYELSSERLPANAPLHPQTVYAAAKASLSMLGAAICKSTATRFCWARLFYLYGPGEHPKKLVRSLLDALLSQQSFPCSNGDKFKDYLYIDDVTSALALLLETKASGHYNICSGEAVSIKDIAIAAQAATGTSGLVRYGALPDRAWDPAFIVGDPGALKDLGWSPRFNLEAGLRDYVRILKEAPDAEL